MVSLDKNDIDFKVRNETKKKKKATATKYWNMPMQCTDIINQILRDFIDQ